ncbi:unnamed protein product, partial [Callosobruchus maculatus]
MSAPASITKSEVSSSLTTAAVKPAADEAFPKIIKNENGLCNFTRPDFQTTKFCYCR